MDEKSKLDLPYGHFGRAEYFPEDNGWHFGRVLHNGNPLEPLGITKVTPSSDPNDAVQRGNHHPPGRRHAEQIKALAKEHPELYPATKLLAPLLRVSEAVQHAVREHEPSRGALLAFAEIRSLGRHKNVPVAAMASGPTGSILRFTRLHLRNHGWDGHKYPHLQVPWLSGEDSVWRDVAEPIQQTCFSQRGNRGNPLLAVRSLQKIHIFQPWHGREFDEGRVGLDLLHSLNSSKMGGSPYFDMSFNTWFPEQIGIVDYSGKWTVLEFDSRQMAKVVKTWTASVRSEPLHAQGTLGDGWARIFWVHDIESVAVCTRTQLTFYNIGGNAPTKLKTVRFDSSTSPTWTVDALVLPDSLNKLCLLNSTHILVYDVSGGSEGLATDLQLKIRHFKNPDDLSLRVLHWSDDNLLNLVIWSSTSNICSHYRLSLHDFVTLSGRPMTFRIDALSSSSSSARVMHLRPVQLTESSLRSKLESNINRHPAQDAQHYIFTVLSSDYALVESLFYCLNESGSNPDPVLDPPSWEMEASKPTITSGIISNHHDTFIDDKPPGSGHRALMLGEPSARRRRQPASLVARGKSTVSLELIMQQLSSSAADTQSIQNLAADIQDVLVSQDLDSTHCMPTLADLRNGELVVDDIQTASAALEQSLVQEYAAEDDVREPEDTLTRLNIVTIPLPRVVNLEVELAERTVSSIYDQLVGGWISSLPAQIPGWVRLAKVAIARRTAVELMLASRTVRQEEKPEDQLPSEPEFQPPIWSLPLRSSEAPSSSMSARPTPEAFALPTPSLTGSPSLMTSSSGPSSILAQSLDRLKRYTTFEKAAPLELPRSLRNVLAHWDVGTSVEEYNWIEDSKRISRQNESEGDDMTEKDRRRARKHAERHLRRQRREAAASQAQQLASSQAAEIFSGSQPPALKVDSSQPTAFTRSSQTQSQSQGLPASQVLPGRFGGRPYKKKKRKVAGF